MSLMGKELNINKGGSVDTFKRGIYIHGTSNEKTIGQPSSHGCIRMKNNDIVELFNSVESKYQFFYLIINLYNRKIYIYYNIILAKSDLNN